MNKVIRVILNILIAIAGLVFLGMLIVMLGSFQYANREVGDPVENRRSVFEYELKHKAYNEIMGTWYVMRLKSFEAPEGMEDIFQVAEYAHAAFMSRVYAEKGDERAAAANAERMEDLRNRLGEYAYTADEVDEIIRTAP